jgi:hypothetical protein
VVKLELDSFKVVDDYIKNQFESQIIQISRLKTHQLYYLSLDK